MSESGGDGIDDGDIGLAEWIAALRAELQACQSRVREAGDDLRFAVGPVELELEVTSGREAEGRGEVKFWVVGTGGSARRNEQIRQRIALTLTPESSDGQPVRVSDRLGERPR
ncbi:trypco2 family protein [Streptomyces sp. 3N207]|uniref:trypco2 family protein n=1 Tax=Streptomyces sp. 3N207 TaxID=3457417 RepID=UPI003FD40394